MKIDNHNLDPALFSAVKADLRAVERSRARKRPMPRVFIYIVALELGDCPSDIPEHQLKTPAASPPISFKERCNWEIERQSYQLIRENNVIWVIGGGREGVLYGFTQLLESRTGAIWAGVGDDRIIFGATTPLPKGVQAPSFPYRLRNGDGPDGATETDYHIWMSRNRFNGRVIPTSEWKTFSSERKNTLLETFESRAMHLVSGHQSMHYYVPESKLEEHPEWRGMRDGKRVSRMPLFLPEAPHIQNEQPVQLCYSNKQLVKEITSKMASHVKQNPEVEIFSIWPEKGHNNWCQCPECSKTTPFEQMFGIALELTKLTPATLPLELAIQGNMLALPKNSLPKCGRIVAHIAPGFRAYENRIYEVGGPRLALNSQYPKPDRLFPQDDRDYGKLFRQWAPVWKEIGGVPGVFVEGDQPWMDETFKTERQRYFYRPSAALRFDEAKWYHANGVRYFYYDTPYISWPDAHSQLAMARSLWNVNTDPEKFTAYFYSAMDETLGVALQKTLAAIDTSLNAGDDPHRQLSRLENILNWLPKSDMRELYHSWVGYVRLAWKETDAWMAEDYAGAIKNETILAGYLQNILGDLIEFANVRTIFSYSELRLERLKMLQSQTDES